MTTQDDTSLSIYLGALPEMAETAFEDGHVEVAEAIDRVGQAIRAVGLRDFDRDCSALRLRLAHARSVMTRRGLATRILDEISARVASRCGPIGGTAG